MLKKIWNSKYLSWGLDAVGIFSLASFLMLGFFLRFIVDILPSCYFTDALIVYVECGKDFTGGFLKFYFQFFSPLIAWIVPLMGYGLVVSAATLRIVQFFTSLLFCSLILLIIITPFRIIYKISKRLLWKRSAYSAKERHVALVILLLALSPSIFAWAVKYYVEPPQSSNRIVTVDMWHSELSFPRNYLQDWSLIDIQRPAEEPRGTPGHPIHSRRKVNPFANLYVSYNEIDPSLTEDEKISIRLVPHYNVMSEEALFRKREDYLQAKIKKQYRKKAEGFKIDHPLYEPVARTADWDIYKSETDTSGYEPDIYVHKNTDGKIQNILECTPRGRCAEKRGKTGWMLPKCKSEDECQNCTRMCQEQSFGTSEYIVHYSFDKKYLDSYFDRHEKILNFIESHSTPKETARFSFTNNNISSWREVDMGFSIKLTENGKQKLLKTTRQNVGKPMKMYVGTLLVSSPVVREPTGGGSAMLVVDDEMKQKILPLLPAEKKED